MSPEDTVGANPAVILVISWSSRGGIGVRLNLASWLWLQAVVEIVVGVDDRQRVQELGYIIKQTTNLSSTFITG